MNTHLPSHLVVGNTISWTTSDGSVSSPRQPPHVGPIPVLDGQGTSRHMEEILPGTERYQSWLAIVGTVVAREMLGTTKNDGPYYMVDFPEGYSLYYRFTKYPQASGSKPRRDQYLWGAKNIVFRSPNEFTPHALWLMKGARADDPCQCIYCTDRVKPSQIDINKEFKLPGIRSHRDKHHYK
ncbi:hypothetical protein CTheo_633 [Ceratobasidium theobromae]|uniref:Cryptic loci regulator 2 N-terminal domain-containing protein n=1 Tax=Ceratobasidium theobromae TaxID=1582974 RepID=A0A5N5QW70_9AGAM|nr:hypothetical protein CTheo_633 [Ceratobasidium theobromae]